MSKLDDRIKWIKESNYSDEWKEKQIAGAISSDETRQSVGVRPSGFGAPEAYWPSHNPNDLPKEAIDYQHYE